MTGPTLVRDDDGGVVFEEMPPWAVWILMELPVLLDPEQPEAVRDRLFPMPSREIQSREEWKRYVHPDLFALLASAREVVAKDLKNLAPHEQGRPDGAWRLPIPGAHVSAWISGLNAARLTLGSTHDVTEDDMNLPEDAPFEPKDERQVALAKINILGWFQQMMIEERDPMPPDWGAT